MPHIKKAVAAVSVAALLAGGAVASANVPDDDLAPASTTAAQGEFVADGFVVKDDVMIAKIAGHQARDAAVAR